MTITAEQKRKIHQLAQRAVKAYGANITVDLQETILLAALQDAIETHGETFTTSLSYLHFVISLRAETSYNPERAESLEGAR